MSKAESIYPYLPIALQNAACSWHGRQENKKRFGAEFNRLFNHFCSTDWMDETAIAGYKKSRLAARLLGAKNNAFYSEWIGRFSNHEIAQFPFDVLNELPILQKEDVIKNYDRIADAKHRKTFSVKTSGTTGKALQLLKTDIDFSAQWAIWFRHRSRFGIEWGDTSVNFTGKPVVPGNQRKPPFWRYNHYQNQHLISMQAVKPENIYAIVEFLNTISPTFYSGYPSILAEVSRLALEAKLPLLAASRPKAIFCGAEKLLGYQRELIETWTRSLITDQYGLTEGNCNFSRCEMGNYHEDFEFCHVEVAPIEAGAPPGVGRLVGTGFYSDAFPLIRYDTGDIATIDPEASCSCGRRSRVISEIDGRVDDFVLTTDGRRVMRFDYLFKDTFDIREVQIIQRVSGQIVVSAALRPGADTKRFESTVCDRIAIYISPNMKAVFEYVDTIPRTGAGKFKAVVNLLAPHERIQRA